MFRIICNFLLLLQLLCSLHIGVSLQAAKSRINNCISTGPGSICGRMELSKTQLAFKKGEDSGTGNGNGVFKSWRQMFSKLFTKPKPDSNNRYHIRIKNVAELPQRHVITRLMRFFPDLTWETAQDIVETATVNDVALVRVVNSKREAELAVDMLRKADPPIPTEIWDEKSRDVVPL